MPDIHGFKDEFRWLSNFWPSPIQFMGMSFPTVEHAYQVLKIYPDRFHDACITTESMTPGQVKRWGRKQRLRDNWDMVRVSTMRALTFEKYSQNPELKQLLLATGNSYIEETNNWGDRFWGVCDGEGLNTLGRILMETREKLNDSESETDSA